MSSRLRDVLSRGLRTPDISHSATAMHPHSQELFDRHRAALLERAAKEFLLAPEPLSKLGSFESVVYEARRDNCPCILKFTHSLHRSVNQIRGELEFVDALADDGLPVCRAITARTGESVLAIEIEDSTFASYCTNKAPGVATKPADWTPALIRQWGEITARMHRTAMKFEPSRSEYRRIIWHDDSTLADIRRLAPSQPLVATRFEDVLAALRELPQARDNFGLVHSDLHHGNFFVSNGQIHPFDFDDSHYNWFLQDIAMPVLYASLDLSLGDQNRQSFAREFLGHFLDGYSRAKSISSAELSKLPLFFALRELDLYAILVQLPGLEANPWVRAFLDGRRACIEAGQPILELP